MKPQDAKDIVGKQLMIGDTVAYAESTSTSGSALRVGKIIRFGSTKVVIRNIYTTTRTDKNYRYPNNVARIETIGD